MGEFDDIIKSAKDSAKKKQAAAPPKPMSLPEQAELRLSNLVSSTISCVEEGNDFERSEESTANGVTRLVFRGQHLNLEFLLSGKLTPDRQGIAHSARIRGVALSGHTTEWISVSTDEFGNIKCQSVKTCVGAIATSMFGSN